jgi:hypothetical protein
MRALPKLQVHGLRLQVGVQGFGFRFSGLRFEQERCNVTRVVQRQPQPIDRWFRGQVSGCLFTYPHCKNKNTTHPKTLTTDNRVYRGNQGEANPKRTRVISRP